jgi:hypothetical protein
MQEKKTKLKIEFWGMKVSNFVQIGGDRTGGAPKPRKSQVHNRETSGATNESWRCMVTLLYSLSLPRLDWFLLAGPCYLCSFFLFSIYNRSKE